MKPRQSSLQNHTHFCCSLNLCDLTQGLKAAVQRCSVKGVLRNFTKFTGKYLCQSLIYNKAKVSLY